MIKNKTILAVILLLALVPLTANATITRVLGFGGEGAAFIIRDAYTPNIWPQLVVDYACISGCEFGSYVSGYTQDYTPVSSWGFSKAYVNWDFGEGKSVIHFALDKAANPRYMMGPDRLLTVDGAYNRLSFIYGRPMGDLKVGLGVNYTGKSYKRGETADGANDDYEASYATYGARLGVTALENNLDAALGIEMCSFSEDVSGKTVWENDGSMTIAFAGRYWYHANDQYALIPNVKFSMMKDAGKGENETAARTVTEFGVGVGNNWKPVPNLLAIFELGVFSQSDKIEYTNSTPDPDVSDDFTNSIMNIYWRLGFETKILEWLNGRFGAERSWRSMTKEWADWAEVPGKPEYGSAITNTYLGATAHWNRFYVDVLVEPMFMHYGPYFISGRDTDMFSRVSLWYKFKE